MATYLKATGRERVVELAETVGADLRADDEVAEEPTKYYDRVIEIDLSELEPYINGPLHRTLPLLFPSLRRRCC